MSWIRRSGKKNVKLEGRGYYQVDVTDVPPPVSDGPPDPPPTVVPYPRVPVIPPLPPDHNPLDPDRWYAQCGECGLLLHRVMGYCCHNSRCPTGLGPIIC